MGRFRALMENSILETETEIDELLENVNADLYEGMTTKEIALFESIFDGKLPSSTLGYRISPSGITNANDDLAKAAAVVLGVGVAALGVKKLFQWAFDKNRRLQNMKKQIGELNIKLKYADGDSSQRIKDKIKTTMEKMQKLEKKIKQAQALAKAKQKQQ